MWATAGVGVRELRMREQHSSEEILDLLESVEVAVVAASAGDRARCVA